jgi:LysM repeat protein
MRSTRHSILFISLLVTLSCSAQQASVIHDYINTYKELAIEEMKRTGVPAAITLAQGIHESGAGRSNLVLASNNHFGIKCKSNWTGESVRHDDDARGECFRKYPKAEDSYRDHSDFLKNGQRYAFLFQLDPADYTGWANGLKKAGYATNPKYPQVLINMVEQYSLQEYTLIALGKTQDEGNAVLKPDTAYKGVDGFKSPDDDSPVHDIAPGITAYREGQFLINETKVVYVKKGTSFLTIAKQYDIDLFRLFEFNEIPRTEETTTDQLVYLQRKRKTGAAAFHTVQPGETLHDIAQLEAIRKESLLELNWLKENEQPAPGQQLSLKKKAKAIPMLTVKENYSITTVPQKAATN